MLETPYIQEQNFTPYISNALRMLLNVTKNNLLKNKELQIVKGEKGIGKTTFCKQITKELIHDAHCITIKSGITLHANDVFRKMLFTYQQKPVDDLKECLRSLSNYLKASVQAVGKVILIFDDAHLIHPKHLEYILQSLEAFDEILHHNLKILLVAESSIENTIQQVGLESIKKGYIHSSLIRPLIKENYQEYLKHLCSVDPLQNNHCQLNTQQLNQLFEQSKGIPALINAHFAPQPVKNTPLNKNNQFKFSRLAQKAKGLSKKLGLNQT